MLLFVLLPTFVSASTVKVDETQAKIEALMTQIKFLTEEISRLQKGINTVDKISGGTDSTKDKTPRIMYWWGKVNQHIDVKTGTWQTDPDGVSGADIDKLKYCKKWFPKTESVKEYKYESIRHWKNRGNLSDFESRKMSFECKEKSETSEKPVTTKPTDNSSDDDSDTKIDSDMQIMYWWGKVNQHMEKGDWETDPDGSSGADIDMLTYCKKWYPKTISVKENELVTADGWHDAGNVGEYTTKKMSYYCVQK